MRSARLARSVIAESRLGFILADAPKLERGFRLEGKEQRSADETWEQPWGERRFVRDRYNELRVRLVEKALPGRRLDVVFRALDDGIGFRYEFPEQAALAGRRDRRRADRIRGCGAGDGLVDPRRRLEPLRVPVPEDTAREVGQAHTPMTCGPPAASMLHSMKRRSSTTRPYGFGEAAPGKG